MVEINLLPWRLSAKNERKNRRKRMLNSFGIGLLIWIFLHVIFRWVLTSYDSDISNLQNQLSELSNQGEDNHFNSSLFIIEQMHANQRELIRFFKIMEEKIQDRVDWSQLSSQNNHIVIIGKSDSVSRLTQFVSQYNSENKSLPIVIRSIKNENTSSAIQFRLQLMRSTSPMMSQLKDDDNTA